MQRIYQNVGQCKNLPWVSMTMILFEKCLMADFIWKCFFHEIMWTVDLFFFLILRLMCYLLIVTFVTFEDCWCFVTVLDSQKHVLKDNILFRESRGKPEKIKTFRCCFSGVSQKRNSKTKHLWDYFLKALMLPFQIKTLIKNLHDISHFLCN